MLFAAGGGDSSQPSPSSAPAHPCQLPSSSFQLMTGGRGRVSVEFELSDRDAPLRHSAMPQAGASHDPTRDSVSW